jgi:transcriptional regulator with XRE-family HTH domain
MPTLKKTLKHFEANKIQSRIYLEASKKNKKVEDIEDDIASAAGITRNRLTYYLNNTSQPDIKLFCTIAQVLECTIDDLIELKS